LVDEYFKNRFLNIIYELSDTQSYWCIRKSRSICGIFDMCVQIPL